MAVTNTFRTLSKQIAKLQRDLATTVSESEELSKQLKQTRQDVSDLRLEKEAWLADQQSSSSSSNLLSQQLASATRLVMMCWPLLSEYHSLFCGRPMSASDR